MRQVVLDGFMLEEAGDFYVVNLPSGVSILKLQLALTEVTSGKERLQLGYIGFIKCM